MMAEIGSRLNNLLHTRWCPWPWMANTRPVGGFCTWLWNLCDPHKVCHRHVWSLLERPIGVVPDHSGCTSTALFQYLGVLWDCNNPVTWGHCTMTLLWWGLSEGQTWNGKLPWSPRLAFAWRPGQCHQVSYPNTRLGECRQVGLDHCEPVCGWWHSLGRYSLGEATLLGTTKKCQLMCRIWLNNLLHHCHPCPGLGRACPLTFLQYTLMLLSLTSLSQVRKSLACFWHCSSYSASTPRSGRQNCARRNWSLNKSPAR